MGSKNSWQQPSPPSRPWIDKSETLNTTSEQRMNSLCCKPSIKVETGNAPEIAKRANLKIDLKIIARPRRHM